MEDFTLDAPAEEAQSIEVEETNPAEEAQQEPKKERKPRKKYPKLVNPDDTPVALCQLTFDWMASYIDVNGTLQDAEWFARITEEHQVTKVSNFKSKACNAGKDSKSFEYRCTDAKALRPEFCKRFFPELLEKKKAANLPKESDLDKCRRILAKKLELARQQEAEALELAQRQTKKSRKPRKKVNQAQAQPEELTPEEAQQE